MFLLNEEFDYTEILNEETGHLDGVEGALEVVLEAERMYSNLQEKMMMLEHKAIITENEEMAKEGKKSFFASFKAIIKRIIDGIVKIFKNFVKWITGLFKKDKEVVDKVKANAKTTALTVTSYPYTGVEKYGNTLKTIISFDIKAAEKEGDVLSLVCRKAGLPACKDISQFKVESMKMIRGAEEKKKMNIEYDEYAAILENYKRELSESKGNKDAVVKVLEAMARDYQDINDGKMAISAKNAKEFASIVAVAYGLYISGLKERRNDARQNISQALIGNNEPKQLANNESVDFLKGILANY